MKKRTIKHNLDVFKSEDFLKECLEKTNDEYRVVDPGSYLYRELCEPTTPSNLNDKYIELIYVTLCSWNMNSRSAKLQEFDVFKQSLLQYSKEIDSLRNVTIEKWNNEISEKVKNLFMNLNLVATGKPLLVTFSKTMHFILPDLIVPIDRKYTLNYFFESHYIPDSKEGQYKIIDMLQKEFSLFASSVTLSQYLNENWNLSRTKIMDNMIIGCQKLQKKE